MSKIKAPTPATAWTSLEAAMLSERPDAKGHVSCAPTGVKCPEQEHAQTVLQTVFAGSRWRWRGRDCR